ncbi:carbohydrate-binding protein [Thalassotalea litorea]|uniref:carbohydrate-binding protein n=1 Tax=Thalassotalea litorea TaxID=2020715 RepID=UPI003734D6EF
MLGNNKESIDIKLSKLTRAIMLGVSVTVLSGCFGVDSENETLSNAKQTEPSPSTQPPTVVTPAPEDVEIPDIRLEDLSVRGRPTIDTSLGYNVILSDLSTPLRGVSLSLDGGDPYSAEQAKNIPTLEQLQSLTVNYGFNTLHVYLEGDAGQNPEPVGVNEDLAMQLVDLTREAKMYLIITVGNNGENGAIHSLDKTLDIWRLYADKFKDESHVIFEAHNEPVSLTNDNWTEEDWTKQAQMYEVIRTAAPDSLILLGSFMSFYGPTEAIAGADSLKTQYPDIWDNAAFAFHAYWNLPDVETTIEAFKTSTDYPALINTEFWPGDTKNGYNEAFENHHIGWMQFEWLGANDLDLGHIKYSLDSYGTVWWPESAATTWPASGSPEIPIGEKVGFYSRVDGAYLTLDGDNKLTTSNSHFHDGGGEAFIVVDAGDDGFIALRGSNGKYLSVSQFGKAASASASDIGVNEKFRWLQLPSGDVALRPWGGSGHLLGTIEEGDELDTGFVGSVGDGALLNGANTFFVALDSHAVAPAPLEAPLAPEPGPFYSEPTPVPTNGSGNHPYNPDAPNGRLWAADFDFGGEAVAYHDSTSVNLGDAYRFDERVDIEVSNEGYTAVGFFENEEWLEYTVDVASAGNYQVTLRVASAGGGFVSIESDCQDLTGDVAVPATGWWDIWQDTTVDVTLAAGVQTLRFVSGGGFNLMNMDIQPGGEGSSAITAGCQWVPKEPADIRVEAEDWTEVIQLPEGEIVTEVTSDADGELNIGYLDAGDWAIYHFESPAAACYQASYRVASGSGSNGFALTINDVLVDTKAVPNTGGWQTWATLNSYIELTGGAQTMRLDALDGAQNINWFEFNQVEAAMCSNVPVDDVLGDNLLSNGAFDSDTGWTVVSQYGADVDGNGIVTIANGVATFSETTSDSWSKHMGLYTSIQLQPGIYEFDMKMSFTDIDELWGEVYIGAVQPVEHAEYSGDQQVIKAFNSWECGTTYQGLASEHGCDSNEKPGRFEITEAGTYYLLFRSGAKTYGTTNLILDDWSLRQVNPPEIEVPVNLIANGGFDSDSGWTGVTMWGADVEGNGVVTIADGVVSFTETVAGPWTKQMAVYTVVDLQPGTYQFDMHMSFTDIVEIWGEVYIGLEAPVAGTEYSGDQQVLKALNGWDCDTTYSGSAVAAGCDAGEDNPAGQFTITEAGSYYLLFRSGGNSYGSAGIVLDDWTLTIVD